MTSGNFDSSKMYLVAVSRVLPACGEVDTRMQSLHTKWYNDRAVQFYWYTSFLLEWDARGTGEITRSLAGSFDKVL